jgi:TP901 family phage tail tape measure protein
MASAAELAILLTVKDMASAQLQGFGQKLGGMGKLGAVAAVGLAGVAAAGVGLVAGLGAAVGEAMDFESAMSGVAAVAGGTDADLKALSDTAIALGQDTTLSGIGATEAARAMRELAAAGLSVDDIVGGAALGALRLASAGGIDVGRAAEIAAMALANFGLEGNQAASVADLFARAANSSAISVDDIAESLKYVGPVAKSMGLSIEDTTAAIAALGNQGIKGTQAGTALRSMIVSLASPSKEAKKIIDGLGLSFFDSAGNMKDFGGISEELKTRMAGLTDQQRAHALSTLFGNEALTAATVLYGEGAAGIAEWLGKVTSGASAADVGAKRNDNLKGSLEALKGSVQTALIAIGMGLTPALKGLASSFASGVSAAIPFLTMLGQKIGAALTVAIGLFQRFAQYVGSAITAVVDAFRKLQAGEITLAQFIGGIKTMIATLVSSLLGLGGTGAGGLGGFAQTVGNAIRAALPIVAHELGILGRAFGDWVTTTAIPWLMPQLQAWLTALGTWLTGTALPWIGAQLGALGQAFGTWITETAIPYLQANLPLWLQALDAWLMGTALPWISQQLSTLGQAFGTWITTTAIPYLQANLPNWLAALGDFITGTALPALGTFMEMFAEGMSVWINDRAIPYLQANLPNWLAALGDFITGTAAPAVGDALIAVGQAMGDWVTTTAVPWLQQKLPEWGAALANFILNDGLPQAVTALTELGTKFGTWVIDTAIPAVQQALAQWGAAVVTFLIGTALPAIGAAITQVGKEMVTRYIEAIRDAPDRVGTVIEGIKAIVTSKLAEAVVAAVQAGNNLRDQFLAALAATVAGVIGKMGEIVAAVRDGVGQLPGIVMSIGGALFAAGAAIIGQLVAGVKSRIGEAIQIVRDGIQQIADLMPGSEPKDPTSPLRGLIEAGAAIFGNIAEGIAQGKPEAVKAAADASSAVAKAITDTLGAFSALASFDFGTNSPSGETMGWFRHLAESLIITLRDVATMVGTEGLAAAKQVGESAGQIGSAVKSTLEGFKALAEYDFTKGSPTGEAMGWFRHLMESIVLNFAQAATLVGGEGMTKARGFAQAVSDVVMAAKNALEMFAKLKEFEGIPAKALEDMHTALEGALDFATKLFQRAEAIKAEAAAFANSMKEAARLFLEGESIGNGIGSMAVPAAPLGVGGGNGGGGNPGGLGGQPTYNLTIAGDVYDAGQFENKVVAVLNTAARRGR